MSGWTRWADARPTDLKANYRWRVSARPILGLTLQPEWTDKLHLCGMGHAENDWWPPFSHWDGYRRTVDPSLEWRVAAPGEPDLFYGGLDLSPSPFTGLPPKIVKLGRWIGAPPYHVEWIGIKSYMVESLGWSDAGKMRDAWNKRSPLLAAAPDLAEALEAVIRVADRNTVEFDMARAALLKATGE